MAWHQKTAGRKTTRGLDPELRRARLLAARSYPIQATVIRRGIIGGQFDGGQIVLAFLRTARDVVDGREGE